MNGTCGSLSFHIQCNHWFLSAVASVCAFAITSFSLAATLPCLVSLSSFDLRADANAMAVMAPELTALDFMTLPRYQVYTSFQHKGRCTGWVQGQTMPPPPALLRFIR